MLIVTDNESFATLVAYNVAMMLEEKASTCSWKQAESHVQLHTEFLLDVPGPHIDQREIEAFDREGCSIVFIGSVGYTDEPYVFRNASVRHVAKPAPVRQYIPARESARNRVGW